MRTISQILGMASMLVLLGACDPNISEHGRADLLTKAGNIIPEQTTENDVQRMLGTPAATAQFGEKTWYYFGSRNESVAFFSPKTVQQDVLRITFAEGVVKNVEHYDQNQAKDIAISDRTTPTAGQKYGFFEQLVGNVGRFNKKQDAMASSRRGGGAVPGG